MRPERGSKPSVAMKVGTDTSVAIYAGGKSSRFGSPKIKAKINDHEFGLLIIETLKRAGLRNISLIGGDSEDARRWGVDAAAAVGADPDRLRRAAAVQQLPAEPWRPGAAGSLLLVHQPAGC